MAEQTMREKIHQAIAGAIRLRDVVENGEEIGFEVDPKSELAAADAVLDAMREPTEAMVDAGMADWLVRSTDRSRVLRPYQAMIDAARDRDAAPRKAEGFEAVGQQPGPSEETASPIKSAHRVPGEGDGG